MKEEDEQEIRKLLGEKGPAIFYCVKENFGLNDFNSYITAIEALCATIDYLIIANNISEDFKKTLFGHCIKRFVDFKEDNGYS